MTTITTPDGVTAAATSTGPSTYGAQLIDGTFVAGNADGTTTVTTPNGDVTTYDSSFKALTPEPAPAAPGVLQDGSFDAPKPQHSVRNATEGGGFNVTHPDGTVDVHYPDGTVVHVNADGNTWHPLP